MSFAGESVIANGRLLPPSVPSAVISSSAGSWYHLLVVQAYSRLKDKTDGECIYGRCFRAGGYQWTLGFYPNGFVSVFLFLQQEVAQPVKAHVQFSFIDEVDQQEPARVRAQKTVEFPHCGQGRGCHRLIKVEDLEQSKHLKNDSFTIRCDFIILLGAVAPFIEVLPSSICEHLSHLLDTKVGADVTFEVGADTFAAHRCVLAARSAVFMAELFGPMKEGTTAAGAIQIQDMEPNVFKALLGFVYTDTMPEMEVEAPEAGSQVEWLRHLLVAADRYDLQRLRSMCEKRLSEHINVSSVTSILGLAVQHHRCILKEVCLEFLKVQSAEDLRQIMATSGWEPIVVTNPSVVNELVIKLASSVARCWLVVILGVGYCCRCVCRALSKHGMVLPKKAFAPLYKYKAITTSIQV